MLEVKNVSKRYGSLLALDDVSASFKPGEIHAVAGENGAGKSTLMGVMTGFVLPDSGSVTLDGSPIPLGQAFACKHLGIEMIHQHFTLVPEFTVEENFALAALDRLSRKVDVSSMAAKALSLAQELGWDLDGKAKVRNLPVGVQQRIEILKALAGDAKVLVFDEPTAVLSPDEVEDLFRVLRELRSEGRTIVLIAHKLSEVMSVSDRVTVLRKGKRIASEVMSKVSATQLATWMVGEMPTENNSVVSQDLREGLSVRDLHVLGDRGEEAVRGLSFEAQAGEILGIGGVDGNGQIELAEALALIRMTSGGSLEWKGQPLGREVTVGYIPQDRQRDGLAMGMTILENMLVTGYQREDLTKGPFLRSGKILEWGTGLIEWFQIKSESVNERVASLSGGNQQKVVVSRTLDQTPSLLVVMSPTRGLDIKATEYVHRTLREARDKGAAVVLFSTDLDELAAIADRTVYMSRGALREATSAEALVGGSS